MKEKIQQQSNFLSHGYYSASARKDYYYICCVTDGEMVLLYIIILWLQIKGGQTAPHYRPLKRVLAFVAAILASRLLHADSRHKRNVVWLLARRYLNLKDRAVREAYVEQARVIAVISQVFLLSVGD